MAEYQNGAPVIGEGQQVPIVDSNGTFGYLPTSEIGKLLQGGGRVATAEDLQSKLNEQEQERQDAEHEAQYGRLSAAERYAMPQIAGTLRGLTFGLSDPAAIAAAPLFGGDSEETRNRLKLYESQAPVRSLSSEVGGALLGAELMPGSAYMNSFRLAKPTVEAASGLARGVEAGNALVHALPAAEAAPSRLLGQGGRVAEGVLEQEAPRGLSRALPGPVMDAEVLGSEVAPRQALQSGAMELADSAAGRELAQQGEQAASAATRLQPTPGQVRAFEYGTQAAQLEEAANAATQAGKIAPKSLNSVTNLGRTLGKPATDIASRIIREATIGGVQSAGQEISNEVVYDRPMSAEAIFAAGVGGALLGGAAAGAAEGIGALKLLRSEATAEKGAERTLAKLGVSKQALAEGVKNYGTPSKFLETLEGVGVSTASPTGQIYKDLGKLSKVQEKRAAEILKLVQKEGSVNSERLEGSLRSFLQENANHPDLPNLNRQLFGRDGTGGIVGASKGKAGLRAIANARVIGGDLERGVNEILAKEAQASTYESAQALSPGLADELGSLGKARQVTGHLQSLFQPVPGTSTASAFGQGIASKVMHMFLPPGVGHAARMIMPFLGSTQGVLGAVGAARKAIAAGAATVFTTETGRAASQMGMALARYNTRSGYNKLSAIVSDPQQFQQFVAQMPSTMGQDLQAQAAKMQQNAQKVLPPQPQGLSFAPQPKHLNPQEHDFLDYMGAMLNPFAALKNPANLSDMGLRSLQENYSGLMSLLQAEIKHNMGSLTPQQASQVSTGQRKKASQILGEPLDYTSSPEFSKTIQNAYAQQNGVSKAQPPPEAEHIAEANSFETPSEQAESRQ